MDAPFEIRDRELGPDEHLIELCGQVDLYTAPEFKERLIRVIEQGTKHIVVDLSAVSFMDSTALGVLVGGLKRLRPAGGSISVVSADEHVRRLFEMAGLDRTFAIS
jgi:anti-sigma B factor antagonist